jgi:hypothetical protein
MAEQLKSKVDTLEELPEELHRFYEQTEKGNFVLAIDGVPPQAQAKINEFRENNINLAKEREELAEKLKNYEGLDADQARDALSKLATMEEQEMVKSGDIETLIQQRLSSEKKEHLKQLESIRTAKEEAEKKAKINQSKLSEYIIQQKVMDAVHNVAVPHAAAMPDILYRAKSQWRLDEDGSMYAVDEYGNKVYAKGSDELISPTEWAKSLVENARHLFAESIGTGSTGSGKAQKVTKNPFLPQHRSLSEQTRLFNEDPSLAARLAREAGIDLGIAPS